MNVIYYLAHLFANVRMYSQHMPRNDLTGYSSRNPFNVNLIVNQDDATNWLGFIIVEDTVGVGGWGGCWHGGGFGLDWTTVGEVMS